MDIGSIGLRSYNLLERLYTQGPITGDIVKSDKPTVTKKVIDGLVRLLVLPGGALMLGEETSRELDMRTNPPIVGLESYPIIDYMIKEGVRLFPILNAAILEGFKLYGYAYIAEKLFMR